MNYDECTHPGRSNPAWSSAAPQSPPAVNQASSASAADGSDGSGIACSPSTTAGSTASGQVSASPTSSPSAQPRELRSAAASMSSENDLNSQPPIQYCFVQICWRPLSLHLD